MTTGFYARQQVNGGMRQREDEDRAGAAKAVLQRLWGLTFYDFDKYHPLEWWASSDRGYEAFLEFKYRNLGPLERPTVWLPKRKVDEMHRLMAKHPGTSGLFVYQWNDGSYGVVDIDTIPLSSPYPGGPSRKRPGDREVSQELVYDVATSAFSPPEDFVVQ